MPKYSDWHIVIPYDEILSYEIFSIFPMISFFSLGRLFTRDAVIVEQDEQVACSNCIVSIEVSRA